MNFVWLILVYFCLSKTKSLSVYQSTLPIESSTGVAGLKYINPHQNVSFSNGITICARFNYLKLGHEAKLFEIGPTTVYFWFKVDYPATWFGFGSARTSKSYNSWILKDPSTEEYNIWYTNKWHHICVAYDQNSNSILFIKVYNSLKLVCKALFSSYTKNGII